MEWGSYQQGNNSYAPLGVSVTRPPDWAEYEQATGTSNYPAYQQWKQSKATAGENEAQVARDRAGMQTFINTNAGSSGTNLATQTSADFTKYGGNLDAYLNQGVPAVSNTNRFEPGLHSSENRLSALLDDPNSISNSAAYQFRVGQGQQALERSLAAKGMLGSGNRLMELTKYGQDMGSQEYDNQFNRLKGLYDTASQSWLGDKGANTARYSAESAANLGRGSMLSDLYSKSGGLAAAAGTANNNDRIEWGRLYEQGRQANQQNSLEKSKLNIGGTNPGTAGLSYSYKGY